MVRDTYRMISGTLTVRDIGPHESISVPNGRHVLEEEYHGGLRSRATGEMLTSGESQTGEETYVAIESGRRTTSNQQILIERAKRPRWMRQLNFQYPQTRIGRRIEIAEIARLIDRMRKITDTMTFDVQIQSPAQHISALLRVFI